MFRSLLMTAVPFAYFKHTRLRRPADAVFYIAYELAPTLALALWAGVGDARASFAGWAGTLATFMCVYEIGYILNDYKAVQFEAAPRHRADGLELTDNVVRAAIAFRALAFVIGASALGRLTDARFLGYHVAVLAVFGLHNAFRDPGDRVATFIGLATLRFWASAWSIVAVDTMRIAFPSVFLFYVSYRAIVYMESKELLRIAGRSGTTFKLKYYGAMVPLAVGIDVAMQTWFTTASCLYFLAFWLCIRLVEKSRGARPSAK